MEGTLPESHDTSVCADRSALDLLLGVDYVRDAVCIGFIANEALSIVENAGLMGMPLPEAVRKGIDVLKSTSESGVSGYGKP